MARAIYIDTRSETINGIPVCKEYLNNGICDRDSRCRYWHVCLDARRGHRGMLGRDVSGYMQPGLGENRSYECFCAKIFFLV